jgi:hypothetical protein
MRILCLGFEVVTLVQDCWQEGGQVRVDLVVPDLCPKAEVWKTLTKKTV